MILVGIDIETTGGAHEICEFAAVAIDALSGKELFAVASLINPGSVTWNPYAMRVHGITPAMVRGKPRINDVWSTFTNKLTPYSATARHFAHNAPFERTHLSNGLGHRFDISLECTMALSKSKFQSNSYKLAEVCAALKIPFCETHRAEPDARAAALIAARLIGPRASASPFIPSNSSPPPKPARPSRPIANLNSTRGVNSEVIATTPQVGRFLAGKRVCITGSFPNGMTKEAAKRLVAAHGGTPVDSVTRLTNLVVLAASGERLRRADITSAKAKEAERLGIAMMSGPEFLRRATAGR
jgi:DNA polymerase-3 subunit epsilon